jgi:3-hydroxyacyl-[acyl-carrier-protein] dehydratase
MELDIKKIMDLIPHRYPFLLVDRVLSTEGDQKIHAIKNVSMNENFFNGHFPQQPIMPGVLMIEAMAQAAVLLVVSNMSKEEYENKIFYFASIENAHFVKPVVPGDVLHLHVEKVKAKLNIWKMHGVAKVDGNKVADATISAVVVPKKQRSE